MPQRDDHAASPSPDSLFATWLARHEAGEDVDFEALCRENSRHSERLVELHAQWSNLRSILARAGLGGSLSAQLGTRFGPGVDPEVTLEDEEQTKSDFSSEVISRLAGRGPASTRYHVKGEVAHGGMGAVLRVWDEDLRRHLAMKVMLGKGTATDCDDTSQVDPRMLARFLEEAQVTGQLDHPGIVPVHELGLDPEGRVYFTMKLVKGKTLEEVLDELGRGRGGWTQARVLGLVSKVCEAMSYAHAKDVIHRDLKPANIMVGRFGEVFVMDWGLAKIMGRSDPKDVRIREEPTRLTTELRSDRSDRAARTPDSPLVTMDGDVVGTPAYMSPEQALGRVDEMGPPSDVYALGAMLYRLLAGHMPYVPPGASANNYAVWRWVQEGPPKPLQELAPEAPAELVAICERAMAREPSRRYPDMSALAEDLSAYVEGRVVRAYEAGAWAEARKWVRRNKPLAAALTAAVALAIGGLASTSYVQARGRKAERVQRVRADAKAEEAQAQRDIARAETAKVLRLSDVKVLQELEAEADELWPAYPRRIPELESWLRHARELAGNLPYHRETLAEMRSRARPWSDEERVRDRESHPRSGELAQRKAELAGLIAQLDQGLQGTEQQTADERVSQLEPEVAALSEEVESRRTWSLDSPADQWQHDILAELIARLERLEADLLAEDGVTEEYGWSVPKRLTFARMLEVGFGQDGKYARAWSQALPAIREAHPGLDLKPQMGLVPIGPDPDSGLWEFAHLMTGEPAQRDASGKLVLTEETGVVLVLLRGGSFWMGAQAVVPDARNYDPQARNDEGPVHEVELSPFFLSKYEMAQGQWLRVMGYNPSGNQMNDLAPTLLHPVEQVSWLESVAGLVRADLLLPSEAQWEYGARGGTESPWWTGAERESLRERRAANLADQAAARLGAEWQAIKDWPELDDGYAVHAPVGTYAANAFGLHEVPGNLWEWCQDGYDARFYGQSPRLDPVSPWDGAGPRVSRGGGFGYAAVSARSAIRGNGAPSNADLLLGFRPARALDR